MTTPQKTFLGLLQRRQCLVPTWRGWLALLGLLVLAGVLFVRNIYGFLAVNEPLPGDILVIEGWSADHVIEGSLADFQIGRAHV